MAHQKQNPPEDKRVAQIIDANLDRAREGLRVLEDWSRFAIGREDFVLKLKNLRQILGKNHLRSYKDSRNYSKDKCRGISHPEQFKKTNIAEIISSNSARVQEALRVIEEFSRSHNISLSKKASEIRYEIYNLEIELLDSDTYMGLKKNIIKNNVYFITPEDPNLLEIISEILEGGIKLIQYRFKKGDDKFHLQQAIEINKLCKKYQATFIINDRIDIALAANADGVHLGQNDLNIESARKLLGPTKIIGISANNSVDIKKAIKDGCDYLGIGPIFKTSTKKNKKSLGIKAIKELTKDITIPWFAIGGIDKENINFLKENGITKVAIISGLVKSKKPKEEAAIILKNLS